MKRILSALFIFLIGCSPLLGETKALIVTIHQKHLSGIKKEQLQMLPKQLEMITTKDLGVLGESVEIFKEKLKELGQQKLTNEAVIEAWDDSRALWVKEITKTKYDNVYIVQGALLDDDEYMRDIWEGAFKDNDIIDYVSFVHTDDQLIKKEWNVPTNGGKLRMVYSSACSGGHGGKHFIEEYKALASAGHGQCTKKPSASPFYSHSFLKQWIDNKSFTNAIFDAEKEGEKAVQTQSGFMLAQLLGGYKDVKDALEGSKMAFAYNNNIIPSKLTIKSIIGNDYLINKGITFRDKLN